jgi:hypothetical protein
VSNVKETEEENTRKILLFFFFLWFFLFTLVWENSNKKIVSLTIMLCLYVAKNTKMNFLGGFLGCRILVANRKPQNW